MAEHNIIGNIGEEVACEMMRKKGFRIVETNWRFGHLEMDIIAVSRKEIAFVEVKTRTSTFGGKRPEEYVDELKRRRMAASANAYVKMKQIELVPRFDIIGLLINPATHEILEQTHLEDAFLPPQRTIGKSSFSGQGRWRHRNNSGNRLWTPEVLPQGSSSTEESMAYRQHPPLSALHRPPSQRQQPCGWLCPCCHTVSHRTPGQ